MRKLAVLTAGIGYLFSAAYVLADDIKIVPPELQGKKVGYTDISQFINNVIILIFIIALIIVLFMLVWGAVEWIFSGGNKDNVANARNRIIHALVGFAILAVAFALARIAGQFLGFDIFGNLTIPSPS